MPVTSLRRLDAVLSLVRLHVPASVRSSGTFDDWAVMAPALVAISADLVEGIYASPPPRGRVRAEIMARSLAEYVIAFAWLAAADNEERAQRLKQYEKREFLERESSERQLTDQLGTRAAYRPLFESGRLPDPLLDETTRRRAAALRADGSIAMLPGVLDRAFQADVRWMSEIELVAHNPFALIYWLVFTGNSFTTHASISAVDRVVMGTPPDLVVGVTQPLADSSGPYGAGFMAFINMLLVASRSLGWPDEEAIHEALEHA